jgi:hypothetical protein
VVPHRQWRKRGIRRAAAAVTAMRCRPRRVGGIGSVNDDAMEGGGCGGRVGTSRVDESRQRRWNRATGRAASCANDGGGSRAAQDISAMEVA